MTIAGFFLALAQQPIAGAMIGQSLAEDIAVKMLRNIFEVEYGK